MSGPWEEFSKPAADDGPWNEFSNGDAKKQNKGIVGDLATDLKRGVQNIPGILSGIGDMVVAPVVGDAIVGKGWDLAGKKTGFQPSKWAKEATAEYSDQRKAGNESVEKAWEDNSTPFKDAASGDFSGLGNVAKAYASNPGVVAGSVAESAPAIVLGGAIGRGVNVVSKMSPIASAWIGEGSVAGSQQMNDAIENGVDARTASAAAWGTALGVGALGAGGGKIAKRFGLADIDTALAGGSFRGVAKETADATLKGSVKEAAKRIAGGAVSEGVFEELPQSALEQTLSNLAQGKPWDDGIARASVEGTLAGSLMGGAFNAIPGRKPESAPSTDTVVDNKPAIAGLLPSPTYTGTPGGQLVASSAERQAAIDKAQSDSDAIWAARDEYERQQEGYRQRPTPTIITDPEPIQHRINALMGIDEGRLSDKARADYEKAIENAFNEKIGVVVGENSLEIPFTMGDYLQSKVAAADISRDKPKAESANQQSVNRLDQLSSEESQQQPDIPVVGTLSRIANLGIRSGVIQRQGVSAVTQQVAPIAAQVQASPVLAETPQIDLRQRTDGQISYLANNGKPGFREAAIAEIQRRGKTNAAKAQPLAQEATQANDAQAGFEQAAAQKAEGLAPAKLSIPPEIVSRVAKRTDNELAFMGKVNRDPVVREAIALEVAMRAADSGRINEQQAAAGVPDATAGESRPAPAADQNPIKKAGPQNRDDLVGAILRVTGSKGIHPKMAQTIVGDKANAATKVRGLFTLRGQQDLDDLAELLRTEEGYDVRDGNHLSNLIREQAAGNPVYSMERTERDAAENEAKKYRAEIRSRAAGLGIKTVAQKFDDIERDVLEAETKQAQDEAAAEREAIQAEQSVAELDDDQLNVLLELAAREANGVEINEQWITNEQILDAFEPIGEEDQDEQGAARAGQTVAGESGGNRQERSQDARATADEIEYKEGKGLAKGKWFAVSRGVMSNAADTKEKAAESLRSILATKQANEDRRVALDDLARSVSEKIKSGNQPTDKELYDLFGLEKHQEYVFQEAVGAFLVKHLGVSRNKIHESLGKAGGVRRSDFGGERNIAYPRKLHEVFGKGFDLAGQTNDQAAEQFAQQKAAQEKEAADKNAANNKSKADAEANDFRLAGSDRAADVAIAGGQTGLFTADGRVSVGAKPAEQTVPAWHTSLPTNGLPITADQRKPGGYSRVPNVLADEAYAAITQNQLMNGMPMYAYYLPAANGMNGIVRLIPDDQNAAKPWVLLNGEAIRPAGQTKEQVIAKLAGWLRSAPVLGDEKAEAKPTDLPKNQQNLSTSPEPVKETAKNEQVDSRPSEDGKPDNKADAIGATVDGHSAFLDRLFDGGLTIDEFKAHFESVKNSKAVLVEELGKKTKPELLKLIGGYGAERYKNDKKDQVVSVAYRSMLDDFVLGDNISYSMGAKYEDVIGGYVGRYTHEDLQAYADKIKARREERQAQREDVAKAIDDPKTAGDFDTMLRAKKAEGMTFSEARMSLTPEQRAEYDRLKGIESRDQRKARADQQKTDVRVASQTTGAQIVEGTHSKQGYPLWSVQLVDRVDGDSYKTLLSTAKRMGGNYVNQMQARMWKTVWGFQFKDQASAEAFMNLAAGDKTDAEATIQERRDAFADDRSQSAVERLNEMAERLEEKADESLGRERKANTERRARFAASAEAAANAEKAMAKTMRRIAEAISNGTAQFLDRVRQKAQIEYMASVLKTAKGNELRTKYPSYAEQQRHEGEPTTGETADYAEFPQYAMMRSDLSNLARKMVALPSMKMLGQRILKVADDTSAAYTDFAKEHLLEVSRFGKADGSGWATFSTMNDAERSIEVSNLAAVAVPLQIKRGEYRIVLSPSEAISRGVWKGDDRKVFLSPEVGEEIVEKLGKLNRKYGKRRGMDAPPEAPWQFENAYNNRKRLAGMGIEQPWEFRAALREFANLKEAPKEADKIKAMERAMIGRKNDGLDFFPTPAETAQAMIDAAEITEGMSVLEPSAGMGHIAERIRDAGAAPDVIEFNSDRRELLEAKGFNVVGNDFMEAGEQYDRIIMNPPFSNRRDAEHVQHAYSLLKPGGRIVAIMGEGVFFGQDKKAVAFREWLDEVGGTSEKLEDGTFLDPSLPVNTATNARMVVIEKPEGVSAPADKGVMLYNVANDDSPIAQEGKRWGATVDDFFAGKISKSESPVILRSTPASLQALGLPDYEIRTSLTHGVEAAMFNHGIKPSQLKAIPLAMADPQAIFVNQGADGKYSLNVLTGMFVNGKQIAIALQPSKYGVSSGPVHFVATITPRENGVFAKMAENGQLVYAGSNIPDDVKRGLNKAKMKYGQSAIDLKALIASKFVSTARTSKVVYKSDLVNLIKSGQAQFSADGDVKISPADKAIYGMAAEGKSASEILKFIASASRSPFNRQVAKLLLKTGINPTITVGDGKGWKMNAGDGHKYAAAYNPGTDTVALFRPASAERHALHELIHAATIKALSKKGLAAVQMRALFAHVQKNGKAVGLFYDQKTKRGIYGMADIDEFIAEAFSNPKFQALLKQVSAPKTPGSTLSSAWQWFVRIVRGILGMPQGQENALSQAIEIGLGVMREDMAVRRADNLPETASIAERNDYVNRAIGEWSNGKLKSGVILDLGKPSGILKRFGVPSLPITMTQRVLIKAVREKHAVEFDDLKDLVINIQAPIAVFKSKKDGKIVVVTEARHTDGNIVVALDLDVTRDSVAINDIRSIYPKRDSNMANWIADGLLIGADKHKGRDWLENSAGSNSQQPQVNAALDGAIIYDGRMIRKAGEAAVIRYNASRAVNDYQKRADQLDRAFAAMGLESRRESSRGSASEYVDVQDPNDEGRTYKFRVSDHRLPRGYAQPDFDVVAGGDHHGGHDWNKSGSWVEAVEWLAGKLGMAVPPTVKSVRSLEHTNANKAADRNAIKAVKFSEQALAKFNASVASGSVSARKTNSGEWLVISGSGLPMSVGKHPGVAFDRDAAIAMARDKLQARIDDYQGKVAPTPDGAATRLPGAPDKAVMQERTVRAVDPGSSEPARSFNGAGSDANVANGEDDGNSIRYNVADDYWGVSDPSKMDDVIYALQDKQIDMKRVVQAIKATGKKIRDNFNPYLQEELFHGRAAKGVKDFLDFELRPLLKEMQAQGVDMGDFEEYLWNRHAEERNKQIAKINPDMPDGGSGINTADARAYLSGISAERKQIFESLAAKVDAMNRNSQKVLVESGLEKQETIDAWNGAYKHYVPLQREDVDSGHIGTGKGFSIRGSSTKRAMGSGRNVVDIIANLTMQRERNIVRAEKNRVSNALMGLAVENPNEDFWTVDKAPTERVVEETAIYTVKDVSGEKLEEFTRMSEAERFAKQHPGSEIEQSWGDRVKERIMPGFKSRDNVLLTRVNGEDHYVIFNERDERAMRMAMAMKNLDADNLGRVLSVVGKATRYLASINTQFNPVFGVINLIRDTQGALINLSSTPIAGDQKKVLGYTKDALIGIYKDIRAHRAGKKPSSDWAELFEEFQNEGGQTGYRDQYANAEQRAEAIQSELKQFKEGGAKRLVRGVFGWLSDYNETMENAVRLATYKAAKERGISKQQAASVAKSITVNFNRKGQVATQVGALYAFFNASVQGSARLAQTLFEQSDGDAKTIRLSKTGKKILAGGIMLGSMQALLLAAAGFDDDEPPEFIRERNLILPIGDGKYLTLAMPLGFHVIPGIGRIATEFVLAGGKDPIKRMASLFSMFAESFNPVGNAGFSLQTIAPSVVDPFAALAENKDFTGKEIYRENFNALNPTPGHARAKDVASVWSRYISEALNFITGGTEFKPGLVSPSPDAIDYLIGQAGGGVMREASKVAQTAGSTVTGEDLPLYKIPLVGRFIGDTEGQSGQSAKFYDALKQINMHESQMKGLRESQRFDEAREYAQENPAVRLIMAGNNVERTVSKLRAMKRDLIEKDAENDQIKAIDERITSTMRSFNERVSAVI